MRWTGTMLLTLTLGGHAMAEELANLDARLTEGQSLATVFGPVPGLQAFGGDRPDATQLEAPLAQPVGSRGSVMLWMRLDRPYRSGKSIPHKHRQQVLELPDVLRIGFYSYEHQLALTTQWQQPDGKQTDSGPLLPGLPAGWLHYAVRWDAEQGLAEHFLNGSPLEQPGYRIEPWVPAGAAKELRLTLDRFAFADVRVSDGHFSDQQLRQAVPDLLRGSLDHLLGRRVAPTLDLSRQRSAPVVYENRLASRADIAGWVVEGPAAIIDFSADAMRLSTGEKGDSHGHMVLWCDAELPARFLAEWEVTMESERSLLITFFNAAGRGGEDLFDPSLAARDGNFQHYIKGGIDTYHASYFASGRGTTNLRKNHGFHLVANGPIGIAAGDREPHRVSVLRDGPRCAVLVDGRVLIDFTDDGTTYGPVLTGGKLGFRQMNGAVARYRNLRIHDLSRGEQGNIQP